MHSGNDASRFGWKRFMLYLDLYTNDVMINPKSLYNKYFNQNNDEKVEEV